VDGQHSDGTSEPSHVPDRHRDRRGRPGPSGANADRDLLESDGAVVVDPDGGGPTGTFFEVPIAGPLPEVLNF
jgi:hypothetical protein